MNMRQVRFKATLCTGLLLFGCLPAAQVRAQNESDAEAAERSAENREEIADSISENTQTAATLKRMLLGRSYVFFGRVEGDGALYSGGALASEDGAEIRRLRVGIAGVLSDRLSYKLELDLTDRTSTLADSYLKLDTSRLGALTLGNQRVSQNLSAMTGTLSQLFMERPLPVTAFSLSRRLGISHDYHAGRWSAHGMYFGMDPNNDAGDRGWGLRGIVNPVRSDGGIAHVGVSLVRERMDLEARYRSRPESHVTDVRLVDTGLVNDVRYQNVIGIEVAGARGAMTGRVEAFRAQWDREGQASNRFRGAYLEFGYFLTGQSFNYRQGKFVRTTVAKDEHAWELGLRASWVDLNDRDIRGGEQVNLGLALNYYFRHRLRIQSNLLHVRTDEIAGDERAWILQARAQFNW